MSAKSNLRQRFWFSVSMTAGLLLLLAVAGCGPRPTGSGKPRVVVFIAVDALRADHLSGINYKRPTTREIDAFAAEGLCFPNALAPASWAAPSLASVLTGTSPREHGIRHGLPRPDGSIMGQGPLPDALATLAERFAADGYATCAVTASPHITREFGFAQGFSQFLNLAGADAAQITDRALGLVQEHAGQPLFLLVHYSDLQLPRQPRAPFHTQFGGTEPPLPGLDGTTESLQATFSRLIASFADSNQAARAQATIRTLREGMVSIYDSNLAALSREVGRLTARLPRQHAFTALFGLCGEGLLEHGLVGNGAHLYTELITVPLIIADGGDFRGGRQIFGPVTLLDLPVTVGERMGWSGMPADGGLSLAETARTRQVPRQRAIFIETSQPRASSTRAVVTWPWKLMMHHEKGQVGLWLSHLGYDPGESRNLAGQQPAVAQELERVARQWWGM